MQIITKSVHIIDYENGTTKTIIPPAAFEEYVSDLISHINDNTTIREFVTISRRTEVIACILSTLLHITDPDVIQYNVDTIATRLLAKETEAQKRIERLDVQVQKGSLIQALLFSEATSVYYYLLAKVEHGGFVDDADFSFKSGFSKDKKTIWKTCLIDLSAIEPNPLSVKIYSNTAAKYWWSDFLELKPFTNDETNTLKAFRAVDSTIKQLIHSTAPYDHTIIRNTFVSYFKNRDHLDYVQMIHEIMDNFTPTDLSVEKVTALRNRLLKLPEERHFDCQFTPVPSVIKARIRSVYDVYQGIQIQITEDVDHIEDVITSYRDKDGTQYIRIKTTEPTTFQHFFNRHTAEKQA